MAYEQKELQGSIFQNHKKTSDSQPGWKGSAKIGGVEYWVSGWVRTTQQGEKWVSLAFTAKNQQAQESAQAAADESVPFDDKLPF